MRVYLVRHGTAVSEKEDPTRPLSAEGRRDIEHVARTLGNMNLKVDTIYHSGKLRSEQTALIIAGSIEANNGFRKTSGLAPNDQPEEALELIDSAEGDILLVGHLPHLDNLLRALVRPAESESLPEFTAGACIGVEKSSRGWQIFRALGPHMIW